MNRCPLVVAVLAAVASTASADQVYRGFDANGGGGALVSFPNSDAAQAAYLAAASAVQTQNFEGMGLGGVPATWTFSGGLQAAYGNQATVQGSIATGVSASQTYGSDGTRYLYSETAPGSGFFTLKFDSSVNGIGFYISDASDWFNSQNVPGASYIEIMNGNSVVSTVDLFTQSPSNIQSGGMMYFGIVTDASFDGIRVAQPLRADGGTSESDAVGFDQFTISVPTPGAAGVLAMAGLAMGRRRRA